jgi:hypothetical protein
MPRHHHLVTQRFPGRAGHARGDLQIAIAHAGAHLDLVGAVGAEDGARQQKQDRRNAGPVSRGAVSSEL